MANTQYQQTSDIETSLFNKGMVKDLTDIYMDDGMWTNAINAVNASHIGDVGVLSNEQSNVKCSSSAPYTIIGTAYKTENEFVLFSTDGYSSEIGIFNLSQCSYIKIANGNCLAFDKLHLITGAVKQNYDKTYSVYWQDNKNVDRMMNLDNVPRICDPPDCTDPNGNCDDNDPLDCDALRLNSLITQPTIKVEKAKGSGQLNNGSYSVCIAYSENGIKLTDYSMPSNAQSLWSHSGVGGGLEIIIEGLDLDFEEYELVVIAVVNQQTVAKKIGNYGIEQNTVHLDIINDSLVTVPIGNIPLRKMIYKQSEKMFAVNDYLIRTGVTSNPLVNYQPFANEIVTEWKAEIRDKNYYKKGSDISYLRDEAYAFFIRWIYNTGGRTHSYHIPGRNLMPGEDNNVAFNDPNLIDSTHNKVWQVYDTSTRNGSALKGKMGYHESTERYPSHNPDVWGDLCGEPIRHHKMPSNERIGIYEDLTGEIYILGVHFSGIKHPEDSLGNKIEDIVGYEILRGSREGNRSIIAKGMFNNMQRFYPENGSPGLYQNYPYNDSRKDNFLTTSLSLIDNGEAETRAKSTLYDNLNPNLTSKKYLSFHSPETTFIKPYLSNNAYIKIYGEERANVKGYFKFPHKHPEHVLLTDAAFALAVVAGIGVGLTSALGRTTSEGGFEVGFIFGIDQHASRGDAQGIGGVVDKIATGIPNLIGLPGLIMGTIEYIANFLYYVGSAADAVANVMQSIMSKEQYALQYDSIGKYDKSYHVNNTHKMHSRSMKQIEYIGNGVQAFNSSYSVNNLNRNKYVLVELNGELPNVTSGFIDNTRQRIKDVSNSISASYGSEDFYKNPTKTEISSTSYAYYGALKYQFDNQYGQISAIVQVPLNASFYDLDNNGVYDTGDAIFGGDIYINRYTEKNPYMFFNEWMFDLPNMTEFNYRNYINGPLPRYWMDSNKFDISDYDVQLGGSSPSSSGLNRLGSSDDVPNSEINQGKDSARAAVQGISDMDTTEFVNIITPSSYHRLDRRRKVSGFMAVRNAYFYLSYNGIRDFYCESELNMAQRDYGDSKKDRFYDVYNNSFNDVQYMFRSDNIINPIYHKYDLSLSSSKLFNNFASWGKTMPRDYNEELYALNQVSEYYPDRAIYSLKQVSGLKRDNWKNYLPLNFKDFGGHISSIKALNATGNVILFHNREPLMFTGVDRIQTEGGTKLTIGDAGLFDDNNIQEMVNADDELEYGTCPSSRAAINTPFGLFWVSNGKIMQYQNGLNEISKNGIKYWTSENLPLKMLNSFPSFGLTDNVIAGVGYQAIYDPTLEIVYFTKKDYKFLGDNAEELQFDSVDGVPYVNTSGNYIETVNNEPYNSWECPAGSFVADHYIVDRGNFVILTGTPQLPIGSWILSNSDGDEIYSRTSSDGFNFSVFMLNATWFKYEGFLKGVKQFECIISISVRHKGKMPIPYDNINYWEKTSFTISYNPANKTWLSFHDWIPDLMISDSKHFTTTKDNTLWKHNDNFSSYCNFYGTDYPWEVDIPILSKSAVTILRSLEYMLEVYEYGSNGIDSKHILDANFDRAIVYNSEQVSGLLKMTKKNKNTPSANLTYPLITNTHIDILFDKEEQKYRFNQFWDITADRSTSDTMWISSEDGVHKYINPAYVDYNKIPTEHKKFRHLKNNVILRKMISGSQKFILKIVNAKQLISSK